jgi:hypothetical protein
VELKAERTIAAGWMSGGWGGYRFIFTNKGTAPAQVTKWTARWHHGETPLGNPWGGDLSIEVKPGQEARKDEVGYLPPEIAEQAKPPIMRGSFTVVQEGMESELPFAIEIPVAVLPEPLKLIRGKTLGIELMESRFKTWANQERALRWLDGSYQAMIELTGYHPYDGALMIIREAPEHPWWAYAGNPVTMNTRFVPEQLADIDKGLMPFGWVHEIGHNFDVLGKWYIWDGASAEFQANFKLAYAFEHIPSQDFEVRWGGFRGGSYPAPSDQERRSGRAFVDAFFTLFGDAYLADPKRTWDTLSSDELHSFFQRLQVAYGWEPFRAWYREYSKLEAAGHAPPETAEGKINLIAAILIRETGVDLVPIFRRWRMPVTTERVEEMRQQYGLVR